MMPFYINIYHQDKLVRFDGGERNGYSFFFNRITSYQALKEAKKPYFTALS
ncbi:hypothetical protein TDIS_1258 [Thermosulfurimonas dismutans]|uniref:Uncharacterized protein n=1 Tax=Thermosulfurimonas dismutans TaxID=999894 RepID=A0A179D3T2_9BACT|nr:hypothetical protein TDIS_1258 [Thermosulfurimonas dismutans]